MQERTRYHLTDKSGNMYINADYPNEDGEIVISMHLKPQAGLSPQQVFEKMGWEIVGETKVIQPKVISFNKRG